MKLIISVLAVILCAFVLWITLKSHTVLRKRKNDTVGRKMYRWLVILFSLTGMLWGLNTFTYVFLFAAVLTERLVVYRGCRGNRDRLSRLLTRINW